jgi:hypothetical protein
MIGVEGSYFGQIIMNDHYLIFYTKGEKVPPEILFAYHVSYYHSNRLYSKTNILGLCIRYGL